MKKTRGMSSAVLGIVGLFCIFSLGYLLGVQQNSAPYFVAVEPEKEDIIVLLPPEESDIPSLMLDEKININTADSKELDRLPDIGPSRAESIVEWRDEHGPFEDIEDIMKVFGIGMATFQTIHNHIMVEGEK